MDYHGSIFVYLILAHPPLQKISVIIFNERYASIYIYIYIYSLTFTYPFMLSQQQNTHILVGCLPLIDMCGYGKKILKGKLLFSSFGQVKVEVILTNLKFEP